MDTFTTWSLIFGLGAVSFLARGSFILFLARHPLPPAIHSALRFVPPAVFTALVLPELVFAGGRVAVGFDNIRLLAGIVAVLVAWRTRNTIATLAAGMLALHGLRLAGLG